MAASPRRVVRAWWRAPAFRRASRRRADVLLVLTTVAALLLGSGAGALVRAAGVPGGPGGTTVAGSDGTAVDLGPVTLDLPGSLGPWSTRVPTAGSAGPGGSVAEASVDVPGVEVDGVWGALAPGGLVVTVLTVRAGTHGGVEQYGASVPTDAEARWSGGREHASGSGTRDGVREDVLVVEASDGALVVLSVAGPTEAFASGELAAAFAAARVD